MPLIKLIKCGALASLLFFATSTYAISGAFSGSYVKGFEPGDPYLDFNLSLSEKLNSNWAVFLAQDVAKNLVIYSENDEWVASDTRFGLSYTLFPNKDEWKLSVSASLTLPMSKHSQANDVYTKPRLGFNLSRSSANGAWDAYLSGYIRDTISAYETESTTPGEGGNVLEDYNYGASQGASVHLLGFSLGYDISYVETVYHKQDRSSTEALDYRDNLPRQGYDFGLTLSRDLWPLASLSISYNQGSALSQTGYEDYVVFDSETSTYGIGFSQGF